MNQEKEAVHPAAGLPRWQTIPLYLVLATLIAGVPLPASAAGKFVAHNTPRYVATAKT